MKIRIPASTANLGPGFDTLGLALNLYLTVEINASPGNNGVEFTGEGSQYLSGNKDENLILKAIRTVFHQNRVDLPDLKLRVDNEIPLARGLGSSAAAVVAGICAADALLDAKMTSEQLLELALRIEGHADNIVPALLGGLNTVMVYEGRVYHQRITIPEELKLVVAVPDFPLPTGQARAVLPEQVALADTVNNLQRACFLVAGFFNRDLTNLNKAMDDMIYQPRRKHMIPGFDQVLSAARRAGALGAAMSGAGPSVLAFCRQDAETVGRAMQEGFAEAGITSKIYNLQADHKGALVI